MSEPVEYVPRLMDEVVADLEKLAALDDWKLQYLKRRQLWRAYSLLIELMGKTETE